MDDTPASATFFETRLDFSKRPYHDFLDLRPAMLGLFPEDLQIGYSPRGNQGSWDGVTYRAPSIDHFLPQKGWLTKPVPFTLHAGAHALFRCGSVYIQKRDGREQCITDQALATEKWRTQMLDSGFIFAEPFLINPDVFPLCSQTPERSALVVDMWAILAHVIIVDPTKAVQAIILGIGDKTRELGMGMLFFEHYALHSRNAA